MQKTKATKEVQQEGEIIVKYMGFDGEYDGEKEEVRFTVNISSSDLDSSNYIDFREMLRSHTDFLDRLCGFLNQLGEVEIDCRFHSSEGDENVDIYVPKNHRLFKHLEL